MTASGLVARAVLKALRATPPLTYLCVGLRARRCGELGSTFQNTPRRSLDGLSASVCSLPRWGLAVGNTVPPSASRQKEICLVSPDIYLSISVHLDVWLAIYPCVAI